jgi:nucleoid-associated protein YgaU
VSRFQKIFLASTIVVVGFGVAKFLGQPVKLPEQLQAYRSQAQAALAATPVVEPKREAPRTATGSVRLLPDAQVTATTPAAAPRSDASLPTLLSPNSLTNTSPPPRTFEVAPFDSNASANFVGPRATLRNEAPRPVGVDPQSPASIRRTPAVNEQAVDQYKVAQPPIKLTDAPASDMSWPAPQLMTAEYSAPAAGANQQPTAIAASFSQPSAMPGNQLAPPPWPAPDDKVEPRTHIIVDGDTLEKLAGRYLSDPQRGREIYELNREMLSRPDLLPIGAELKIPDRIASVPRDRQAWQPNSSLAHTGADATRASVANPPSVQPSSLPTGIIPRAQLSRPVMVE